MKKFSLANERQSGCSSTLRRNARSVWRMLAAKIFCVALASTPQTLILVTERNIINADKIVPLVLADH